MNWNLFQRQSFKSRVTLTTALVFMLILWSLALYGSKILRANLVQLLADQQLSAASYVASDINGQFKDRFEGLELISHAIDAPLIHTPPALQQFLEARYVLHSLFNGGVIVYDLDYKAIADVPVIGRTGVDYSDRDSVVKAIREGKSSISRPAIGKKLQTPSFLLTVPIHDAQGHVMGALSGVVDLGKPNFLTRITEHTYGKTGGYVLVAPQHRLIVAATDKSRIMEELPAPGVSPLIDSFIQGYEGTDVFVNPVGVEVMASAKGIPVAGWYVVAILPTEEAFAPIKDLQRQMFLAAILLTLVTGISTWWILRRELAPLLSAANTLASMSVSDTSHHFLPITRQDEIGDLIGSFNMLLQTLRLREASLKDSEFRWKFAIEGSGDGLWDWDVDKGTVWFSKRWKEMLGFDDDGISNHPDEWEKRIHPDDIPDVMAKVQSHLDGQLAMFTAEHRLMCKDGNYKWVLGRGMVVNRSEDGKPLRMIGTNTDISARKIAEEGLIEAERKFRALFEMSPIGVAYHQMIYDDAGKPVDYYFLDANESYLELTGADPRGRTVLQAFPGIENDSFDWIGTFGHVALTGEPIRFEQHFKSNNRWYDCVAYQYKPDQFVVAFMEITKRKQVEFALRESEERFRTLMENIPGIAVQGYALDGTVTFWNHASEVLYGHTASEALGAKLLDLIIPADMHEGVKQSIQTMINTGEPIPASELHLQRKDGSLVPVFSSHALLHPFGRPAEMFCLDIDLTERKQADSKLQLAASVFSNAREGIMITTADGNIVEVNESFTRITGYEHDEVLGRNPRFLGSGRQDNEFYAAMWRSMIEKHHWYGETWNRRKNGEIYAQMQTITAVRDASGNTQHYVSLFSDITALKEHERQLEHIAHYDSLTALPNRVLLADRLHQAMAQSRRRGQRLAVAYLDLDGFKVINDRHGHETGDHLLMSLAARMKQALREGDTIARLGGDEFVAVLLDLADNSASVPMLNRLLSAASLPAQIDERTLQVSASIGVTFYPQSEEIDADQLLRQADQAMYQAKLAGKNRYYIFDAEQDKSVRGHHESLEHIRLALARKEFVLHYQPKVNMRTGEVIGAEALIRWKHPEKGLLAPGMFLPAIEFHQLAVEVGEWVIDTALHQKTLWKAAGLDIPISVNLSARHLQQVDFVARLKGILATHPTIKPGDLELEVLETSALEDLIRVSEIINDCRDIGICFALDDFGTGYSSLTYLKRLPVSQIKIDQSFVRHILDDLEDLAILEAMLSLSAVFKRQIIAEGAETSEHCAMLLRLGCDLAQGYGIARPMSADNFPSWAASWRPDPGWSNPTH